MPHIDANQMVETQRQDWNRVASAWEKWDKVLERNLAFVNYRLIGDARLRLGQQVLDIGCGTGYPALLAAQAVGAAGRVHGLDLAEEMLEVARRKAGSLGITNITFQTADATTLSFEPDSYDAVISRFCLMFLPDIHSTMRQIARLLKPGGYLAAAVWSSADKNPFLKVPMDVLKKFIEMSLPDPEQPGLFRLAKPRELLRVAERAGLQGVTDEEMSGETPFESADEYLASLMEMAAPIQMLFNKLSFSQRSEVQSEIKRTADSYRRGDKIFLPVAIRVVVARKP
ncbi:MAG: methyltransferase domain-containing protein [Deltaproteobacteria bacterium]|nr:methyltransferase domain-containing protein [Deltaproteobacteria bacterium]